MMETLDIAVAGFGGVGLHFQMDGFRLVYTALAVLMWLVCGLFSREYMAHYTRKGRYYFFFWVTFLATVGVFLSASLYTTFLCFETLSFTSFVWVAFDEGPESLRAAGTYLAVAVIGGLALLMGLFLLWDLFGTLEMDAVAAGARQLLQGKKAVASVFREAGVQADLGMQKRWELYAAGGLMLFGFGAKAGMFPLHIWLPQAHPVAPAPASALLSGILTKTGVFGIIFISCRMFLGDGAWGGLIAVLGLVTMLVGAVLALFSMDLKRTLACSSVSQIGFILTGIGTAVLLSWLGEGYGLAARGVFLHMINHSLLKLVLFLCAGAVYQNLHQLNLNDIRGFGRGKKRLMVSFLMGALGISGVPFWNGYVSKTLLHEGIVEYVAAIGAQGGGTTAVLAGKAAEVLFLFAGGMTAAYMIKLFVALFVERHPNRQQEFDALGDSYMSPLSGAVLLGSAVLLPFLGMFPHSTMDILANLGQGFFGVQGHGHPVAYLSAVNLKGGLISLAVGLFLYLFLVRGFLMREENGVRIYVDRFPAWLNLETLLYRPVLLTILPGVCGTVLFWVDRWIVAVPVRVFLTASTLLCRAMDQAADAGIWLARRTTHRQLGEPHYQTGSNWLGAVAGHTEDRVVGVWDCLSGRRRRLGRRPSSVGMFKAREAGIKTVLRMVEESFSFGLMLFCLGLCATLAYLFWAFFHG